MPECNHCDIFNTLLHLLTKTIHCITGKVELYTIISINIRSFSIFCAYYRIGLGYPFLWPNYGERIACIAEGCLLYFQNVQTFRRTAAFRSKYVFWVCHNKTGSYIFMIKKVYEIRFQCHKKMTSFLCCKMMGAFLLKENWARFVLTQPHRLSGNTTCTVDKWYYCHLAAVSLVESDENIFYLWCNFLQHDWKSP